MDLQSYSQWRPHPWHGLEIGPEPPGLVYAYIEITPFDMIKYEVDKETGYLRVDRPQRTSSVPPTLYGFIPRTYCGQHIQALSPHSVQGDGDPLDICVISERPISKSEIILTARVVGYFQMLDGGEADDKIVAVLVNDSIYGNTRSIHELPHALVDRLQHYFSTYKLVPGQNHPVSIEKVGDRDEALRVVEAAIQDYQETFGHLQEEHV